VLGEVGVPARELRRRAKEVADGGFVDEAVRRAVAEISAATSAAITAASASA